MKTAKEIGQRIGDKGIGFIQSETVAMKKLNKIPLSPFHCPIALKRLARQEFDALSRQIMAHVFASQNDLGRLCDEAVYRNDIALRLQAVGLGPVGVEVPLSISLRDFTKTYRLDLVVRESFVIELKTAITLVSEHESQLLNYLLIAEMPHGKLINLRPASVEYRTINAVVAATERRRFHLVTERWNPRTPRCRLLQETVAGILEAWGTFLDCRLYEEALIHFLGGERSVLQNVPLRRADVSLGAQTFPMVADSIAFRLTALDPEACRAYEPQLRHLLALTPLTTLHWLNFHHHDVQLVTITR